MDVVVEVECPVCSQVVHVLPPAVFDLTASVGGTEAELHFAGTIGNLEDERGHRFAIADAERYFTCPSCTRRWRLPELPLRDADAEREPPDEAPETPN